ncbi:MAG TPA: hypothetical protein VFQ86_10720 [Arachidicoccus soli]|nr:hypothetical protein [Arachidicoccus soli]
MKYLLLLILVFNFSFINAQTFYENKGQVSDFNRQSHKEVQFYANLRNTTVFFQNNKLVYSFLKPSKVDEKLRNTNMKAYDKALRNRKGIFYRMDMVFEGANEQSKIQKGRVNQGVTHFYLGEDRIVKNVHSYKTILYKNIYPNIDILFHSTKKGLKYDIILNKGASIDAIKIAFDGAKLSLNNNKLKIMTKYDTLNENIPLSFIDGDKNRKVDVKYILNNDGTIGFKMKKPIIDFSSITIDPVLEWGTYFNYTPSGGGGFGGPVDYITNYLDADGNFYSYMQVLNTVATFPIVNPGGAFTGSISGNNDLYIAKFSANRTLVWSAYLGGTGYDSKGFGTTDIAVQGSILHLTGEQITSGAPFTNGGGYYQNTANRNFWARFNKNTGQLLHLTSLSSGYAPSIAVSGNGKVVIVNDAYDFNNLPILNRSGAFNQGTNGGIKIWDYSCLMLLTIKYGERF